MEFMYEGKSRMRKAGRNYGRNLVKLLRRDRLLDPLAVSYYVTTRCNLNCAYCEDFGARRNASAVSGLPLEEAKRVLEVIRSGTDTLIFTGGEPLLHPDIAELALHAKEGLKFRSLSMLSNGSLLPRNEAVLPALDRLVISLDSTDPEFWREIINAPLDTAEGILDNVAAYARRQEEFGYRMAVNCVLTPETLPGARKLVEFCMRHDLLVSFSPQAVNNWPAYDLLVSEAYKEFLGWLAAQKRKGAPILGSDAYLRTLLDFHPYSCYPTLVPRVMPNGELAYPCRPIEKNGGSHGGRPVNLLAVSSWQEAVEVAVETYGPPPRVCTSCFQQCYAEPSLMQARPFALLGELIRYPGSRRAGLESYAPG